MMLVHKIECWPAKWYMDGPDMKQMRKNLNIKKIDPNTLELSVFRADSEAEVRQNLAATLLVNPRTVTKTCGLVIYDHDYLDLGIRATASTGKTGVKAVDERHYDLIGSDTEFADLIKNVIRAMWKGDRRMWIYPPQSILAELGMVYALDCHANTREVCRKCLDDHGGLTSTTILIDQSAAHLHGTVKTSNSTEQIKIQFDF